MNESDFLTNGYPDSRNYIPVLRNEIDEIGLLLGSTRSPRIYNELKKIRENYQRELQNV